MITKMYQLYSEYESGNIGGEAHAGKVYRTKKQAMLALERDQSRAKRWNWGTEYWVQEYDVVPCKIYSLPEFKTR